MTIKRHKPPSRIRYEQGHPIVSFRVERITYNRLFSLIREKNLSIADFFKIALGEQDESLDKIRTVSNAEYERGYDEGLDLGVKLAHNTFDIPCNICGKGAWVDIRKNPVAKQIIKDAFKSWSHTACPKE